MLTSPEHLAMIFTSLESAGMLETDGQEEGKRGLLARLSSRIHKAVFRSLTIPDADRVVNYLYGRVSWLFRPVAVVLVLSFALSGFIPLSHEISEVHHLLSKPALAIHSNPLILIELYVLMTLVTVLHEFSHALTCKHFGGSVHRIGIMFYLAMIIVFADVSAAWGFQNKWKRIAVAAAGPILNLVVMSLSFWIWHFHKAHVQPEHSIWFLLGFFCLYSTVLNFIPLIKMDGYYILTDLTGISTLREKSFAYLGQKLLAVFGIGREEEQLRPKARERWILWSYGLAGAAGTVFFLAFPFVEFVHYIAAEHPSEGMLIFLGVIVALTLYNAAYRAYQMAHSRLNREIVIA
jgi:putative peptide zinc metalloprotease protein